MSFTLLVVFAVSKNTPNSLMFLNKSKVVCTTITLTSAVVSGSVLDHLRKELKKLVNL